MRRETPCPARISAEVGFARLVRRMEARATRLRQISLRVAQALCGWIAGVVTVGFRLVIDFMRRPVAQVYRNMDGIPDAFSALQFSEPTRQFI
jgi:hypothetical protein